MYKRLYKNKPNIPFHSGGKAYSNLYDIVNKSVKEYYN